jgi:hypothetical protein
MFIIRKTSFQYNDESYSNVDVQIIHAFYKTQKEAYEQLLKLECFEYTNTQIPLNEIEPFNSLNGGLRKEVVDKINQILGKECFVERTYNYTEKPLTVYDFELKRLNPTISSEDIMKIRELTGLHFYDLLELDEPILYQATVNIEFLKLFKSIKTEKVEVGREKRTPIGIFEKIGAQMGKEYTIPVFKEVPSIISVESFCHEMQQSEYPEPVYFTKKMDFSEHDYFLIKVLEANNCNLLAYNSLSEVSNSPAILSEWLKTSIYVKHDLQRKIIEIEFKWDFGNTVLDYKTERNRFFVEASTFYCMLKEPPFHFKSTTLKEVMQEKEERETEEFLD